MSSGTSDGADDSQPDVLRTCLGIRWVPCWLLLIRFTFITNLHADIRHSAPPSSFIVSSYYSSSSLSNTFLPSAYIYIHAASSSMEAAFQRRFFLFPFFCAWCFEMAHDFPSLSLPFLL